MAFTKIFIASGGLGGRAFCFVSPARYTGSSLTYAKRSATQTLVEVFDV